METRVELHITSYEAKNFRGWVYNSHFQKKIEFYDLCGMLSSMESLYDTLAFPQATFQPRHFGKVKKTEFIPKKAVDAMAMEENDRATFVVHVQFRPKPHGRVPFSGWKVIRPKIFAVRLK